MTVQNKEPSADLQEEVEALEKRLADTDGRDYGHFERQVARDAIALLRRLSQPAPSSITGLSLPSHERITLTPVTTPPPPAECREAAPEDEELVSGLRYWATLKPGETLSKFGVTEMRAVLLAAASRIEALSRGKP